VKPIITINPLGKAILFDKAFSETKGLTKIVSYVSETLQSQDLDSYCIVHAGAPEKALEFAKMTTEAFGQPPAFIEPASTAIGLHAGRGCVGLVAMMK